MIVPTLPAPSSVGGQQYSQGKIHDRAISVSNPHSWPGRSVRSIPAGGLPFLSNVTNGPKCPV